MYKTIGVLYDEESFESVLNELVENTLIDVGLISRKVISDEIIPCTAWIKIEDFCNGSHITKLICLRLIKNPDMFFVLLNTQKGKMKIMNKDKKIVCRQ